MLLLIYEFFKTGLFSIGGGIATIPFLYSMAARYGWTTNLSDTIAFGSAAPGPTGVNMAVYFGFTSFGVFGGLAAMLALVFPSIVAIIVVSRILKKFGESKAVACLFTVLRPASAGLLATAVIMVSRDALFTSVLNVNTTFVLIFALTALVLGLFKLRRRTLSPVWVIVIGGVAGYVAG